MSREQLFGDWYPLVKDEFENDYMLRLMSKVRGGYREGILLPRYDQVFKSLKDCPLNKVKVVIVGQAPYAQDINFNGRAFAATELTLNLQKIALTLDKELQFGRYLNIFKGDYSLQHWVDQGVLLINSRLTIIKDQSSSHRMIGWEMFIARLMLCLSSRREGLVFMAWGDDAKEVLIPSANKYRDKNLYLKCEHPMVAHHANRDWNNRNCFSLTNKYLKKHNKEEILW